MKPQFLVPLVIPMAFCGASVLVEKKDNPDRIVGGVAESIG